MSDMTIQNAIHCMKAMICEEVCEECDYYGKTGTDHCEADAVRMAIKALEEQPQWIPCSERMPEEDGRYLVTCSRWGAWAVDWNIWSNEPKPSWLWEQGVTAWMPLPKGYTEVRANENT